MIRTISEWLFPAIQAFQAQMQRKKTPVKNVEKVADEITTLIFL